MKILYQGNNSKIYIKFKPSYQDDATRPLPYVHFVIGIEIQEKCWENEYKTYKAEEEFVMDGPNYKSFLNDLKRQIYDYKTYYWIEIVDYLCDTDAKVEIKCEESSVLIKLKLGNSLIDNHPVLNFEIIADSSFLVNLYESLIEHTEF